MIEMAGFLFPDTVARQVFLGFKMIKVGNKKGFQKEI